MDGTDLTSTNSEASDSFSVMFDLASRKGDGDITGGAKAGLATWSASILIRMTTVQMLQRTA